MKNIWTLREPSTQVLSVYLRLSAKTKSLPLKTNFILVSSLSKRYLHPRPYEEHRLRKPEAVSTLPSYSNTKLKESLEAQQEEPEAHFKSTPTALLVKSEACAVNKAPFSRLISLKKKPGRRAPFKSSFLKHTNGSTREVRSLCSE